MANGIGEPRVVEASRGAAWWGEGWRTLTSNFWTWIGIMIVYFVITWLISSIEYVGVFGYWLLTPVFMGGLMLGCRAIDRDEPLRFKHLFEGFQGAHFVPLMIIGAVNLAIFVVVTLAIDGVTARFSSAAAMQADAMEDPISAIGEMAGAFSGAALLLVLLIIVIVAVYAMLNWFAPALVALQGATALQAMKLSFFACLRNWVPFLVYGAIAIAIWIAAMGVIGALALVFGVGAIMALLYGGGSLLDGGSVGSFLGLAVLFVVVIVTFVLIVWPIVFGSAYAGYKDVLAVDEAVAPNPAYR